MIRVMKILGADRNILSSVKRLKICSGEYEHSLQEWQEDMEDSQWLDLLCPFTAVESFHITEYLGLFMLQTCTIGLTRRLVT